MKNAKPGNAITSPPPDGTVRSCWRNGAGRAYPKITAGAGLGIIDDMPSDELLEVIKDIDKNGSSLFYYEAKRPDVAWDYRGYDMQLDNLILKGEIEENAEGYSAFEAYL